MKKHADQWSLFRLSDRVQFDNVSLDTIDFFFRALSEKTRIDWLMWREGFSGWRPLSELSLILKHLNKDHTNPAEPPPVPEAILNLTRSGVQTFEAESETQPDVIDANEAATEISAKTHSSVSHRAIEAATSSMRQRSEASQPKRLGSTTPLPNFGSQNPPAHPPMSRAVNTLRENGKVLEFADEATLSLMLESQAATEDRDNVRYPRKFKVRIFTPNGVLQLVTTDCSTSGFRLQQPLPSGLPRFFHVEIDLGLEGKIPVVCSEIREKDGRGSTRVRIQVNDNLNILKSALVRAA